MAQVETSRVAEMLFSEMPLCDFYRTISELGTVLTRICGQSPRLTWDCDDVASFDMPGTRILLSLSESPYPGYEGRLVVSVGPSPIAHEVGRQLMVHAALCSRLVNRLKERCEPDEIIWSDVRGIVSADEVDMLAEGFAPPVGGARRPGIFTPGRRFEASEAAELKALRAALYPQEANSTMTRLSRLGVDLAIAIAILPVTAAFYAAALYRATVQ